MKKYRILCIDDDENILFDYQRFFIAPEYQTHCATTLAEAKTIIASDRFDALILVLKLPDGDATDWIPELKKNNPWMPIIIITSILDIPAAANAIKHGAESYLIKPVAYTDLKIILLKCLEQCTLCTCDDRQQIYQIKDPLFYCQNDATIRVLEQANIAASTDVPVLLLGESGTGKGVLSRWIHDTSNRKSGVFVEVNCSILKGELLRSELFGHVRGSFTSAIKDRKGLIEIANGGTLFLDEIGDMSAEVQTQILKTIEEKTFRRLGDTGLRTSDFRLICATHRDLNSSAIDFRKDLYFRISAFPITLLPLREKKEEIPELSKYLLSRLNYREFPLQPEITQLLSEYSWPGNIRELKNILERALLLAHGTPLLPKHFPDLLAKNDHNEPETLIKVQDVHIIDILHKFKGDKSKASKALGISLSSLYRRLAKIHKTQSNKNDEMFG